MDTEEIGAVYDMKIGRKQTSKQSDFLDVYRNIDRIVSKDHIKRLEEQAVEHLIQSTQGKRVEYGWSGGKDSLTLQRLCEQAGITKGFYFTTDLEYSSFDEFAAKHKPDYIKEIRLPYDLFFLIKNPEYLFPKQESKIRWLEIIQRKNFEKYFWQNNLDQIVLGHRTIDGNHCPSRLYRTSKGYTKNMPIFDWSQEDIIAYLHYNDIPLPDIYFYDQGFMLGTGPWCKLLQTKERDIFDCWEYVFQNEREIVLECAAYFPSAKSFIERKIHDERNP